MSSTHKHDEEVTMVVRLGMMSLLVVGIAAIVGDASAHFQIPAMAGAGADPLRIGAPHFQLTAEGYVQRTSSAGGTSLDWIIPLPFHAAVLPPPGDAWSVQVMVSNGVSCSLKWKPNDLPGGLPGEGTRVTTIPGGGLLDLTVNDPDPAINTCPGGTSAAAHCVTGYSTAYVQCTLSPGQYVGAVTYTIM